MNEQFRLQELTRLAKAEQLKMLEGLIQSAAEMGASVVMETMGLSAGEVSWRQAKATYKGWFVDATKNKRLVPIRTTGNTHYYSISAITKLRTQDFAKPFARFE